jgi:excisionase family DNA binding protein
VFKVYDELNGVETLTANEVMEVLRISRNTCYNLMKTGKIDSFKIGEGGNGAWRVPKASLEQFIFGSKSKKRFSV